MPGRCERERCGEGMWRAEVVAPHRPRSSRPTGRGRADDIRPYGKGRQALSVTFGDSSPRGGAKLDALRGTKKEPLQKEWLFENVL